MPIYNNTQIITLTAGGGTENLDVYSPSNLYIIKGVATLTSNWTIQSSGTPVQGLQYDFKYEAEIDLDGNTITIFGKTLPATLADKTHEITAYYDGVDWEVNFKVDVDENGSLPAEILSSYNEADKISLVTVPISFETGEMGYQRVYFPFYGGNFEIHEVYANVTKDIESTDYGIVKFYTGTVTPDTPLLTNLGISFQLFGNPLSIMGSAHFIGDGLNDTHKITSGMGGAIFLETSKVTPGGKALLTFVIIKD